MDLSLTTKIIIVFVAILLIISSVLIIYLHNGFNFASCDQVARREFIFGFSITLGIVGILLILFTAREIVSGYYSQT